MYSVARIAYAVDVNFDGDIASSANGFHILTGEDALSKTRKLVKTALEDMFAKCKEKDWDTGCYLDDAWIPLEVLISNDELFDAFIEYGGDDFGNWRISIQSAEEE
jgi:hypothetical protein